MYYFDSENFYHDELDSREVMVTIRCITYNHENFIRDALDGFVMQKTNFRFEAIVHDDASTDKTAAIIREYALKYPSIIKPIFEEENQYSKQQGNINNTMNAHSRGKYIALCEGDDYWTDPDKLQKQFDLMECHSDVSLCFHNAIVLHHDGKEHPLNYLPDKVMATYELANDFIVPTASIFFRREVLESEKYLQIFNDPRRFTGDLPLVLSADAVGKVWSCSEIMSVYRKHSGGVMNTFASNIDKLFYHYCALIEVFGNEVRNAIRENIAEIAIMGLSNAINGEVSRGMPVFIRSLKFAPFKVSALIGKWYIYRPLKKLIRRN